MKKDLLIELGCEELPPKSLKTLGEAFESYFNKDLNEAKLSFTQITLFLTPRRLALLIEGLETQQADRTTALEGPPVSAALDKNGQPTPAALGFAKKCGVSFDQLDRTGPKLRHQQLIKGKTTSEVIPDILKKSLETLPIAKRMRWGSSRNEFVRPPQWLIVLFGKDIISCEVLGLQSGARTRGHRFHSQGEHVVTEPKSYESLLKSLHVLPRFEDRLNFIKNEIKQIEAQLSAQALVPEALLEEVTALVEWPVPLVCSFEDRFLQVPQEALIATMQDNQKYFCLTDKNGRLINKFITFANVASRYPQEIIEGNEKVVRPRLTDAEFFFKQDQKHKLESHLEKLAQVVFQAQLGTIKDRVDRLQKLTPKIGASFGANTQWCARAAELSKCDLTTLMVNEFPEMQGLAGAHYARLQNEPLEVAEAIKEQYMPKGAGLEIPQSKTGIALALAEKLDTLVGIFGIGQAPTGSKDPYALRRAALGLIRILIEHKIHLDLKSIVLYSIELYGDKVKSTGLADTVLDFIFDRLRARYEEESVETVIYLSVRAVHPMSPSDFNDRVLAVQSFKSRPEAMSLSAANKRVANILSKSTEKDGPTAVQTQLLTDPNEKHLFDVLTAVETEVIQSAKNRNYSQALEKLAQLKEPVDTFFDKVLVNAEDPQVRKNRLALLHKLRGQFLTVADISFLGQ